MRLDGVQEANVNLASETVKVKYTGSLTLDDFEEAVENAGYKLLREKTESGVSKAEQHQQRSQNKLDKAYRNMWRGWALTIPVILWMLPHMFWGYAFLGAIAFNAGMLVLSGAVIFAPGRETIRSAWKSAKNGTPNMDVLIAMGSLAALATGVISLLHQFGWAPAFHSFAG